jgi:hypothetical protein
MIYDYEKELIRQVKWTDQLRTVLSKNKNVFISGRKIKFSSRT